MRERTAGSRPCCGVTGFLSSGPGIPDRAVVLSKATGPTVVVVVVVAEDGLLSLLLLELVAAVGDSNSTDITVVSEGETGVVVVAVAVLILL